MKYHGSSFEYERERNEDLMRAFRTAFNECPQGSMDELYEKISNMPSKRFWVSEERAFIAISAMLKGRNPAFSKYKVEMYQEILRRVKIAQRNNPNEKLRNLVFMVVNQPAPKFYLSPKSAMVIIYKIKRKWYETRKQKLRHLY